LQVAVTRIGEVSLIAPAGCSATVPPDRIRWLVEVLTEARATALRGERQLNEQSRALRAFRLAAANGWTCENLRLARVIVVDQQDVTANF